MRATVTPGIERSPEVAAGRSPLPVHNCSRRSLSSSSESTAAGVVGPTEALGLGGSACRPRDELEGG
eukprot:5639399-Prymnesium_polylepis.2